MMRIAIIDHSYHETTRSTVFFRDILERLGTVRHFYDETWCGGANAWRSEFDERDYDLIVVWQAHEAFSMLSGTHPNVVFVPMYDAMRVGSRFFWHKKFGAVKSVSFCRKLHQEIVNRNGTSRYFKFFPDPAGYRTVTDFSEIRPFFWYRTGSIDVDLVLDLSMMTRIEGLTIHNFPDPQQPPLKLSRFPANVGAMHVTQWFEDAKRYTDILHENNVFFAPRALEGIGMAFLEAMACGLCVVAPDAPTMNEYIANGTNGLLYLPDRTSPLDFSRAAAMGARARETVERGFADWQNSIPELVDFLVTPKDRLQARRASVSPAPQPAPAPAKLDKVCVVTVCLNAAEALEETITSVLEQDRKNVDYVIIDGGSRDASLDIIKKHGPRLAHWRSEPDEGVYHAMNKAIDACRGDWILFMNAGDKFSGPDSLSRMFRKVPDDADVVYGHHFYVPVGSAPEYRPAADFDLTWDRLQRGDLWFDWLAGIPGHQATAIRRSLLARLRFDTSLRIAADHDLLFRARRGGASFFHCDEVVSLYFGGGMSAKNYELCKREWAEVACRYGDAEAARNFYWKLGRVRMEPRAGEMTPLQAGSALGQTQRSGLGERSRPVISRWMRGLKAALGPARTEPPAARVNMSSLLPDPRGAANSRPRQG